MADKDSPDQKAVDAAQAALRVQLANTEVALLQAMEQFVEFDARFNDQTAALMAQIVQASSGAETTTARIAAGAGNEGPITQADWVDMVARLINALGRPVGREKAFWFAIFALIRCGCSHLDKIIELLKETLTWDDSGGGGNPPANDPT